jgi:hypothetical protein
MSLITVNDPDKLVRFIERIYKDDPEMYCRLLWLLRGARIMIEPSIVIPKSVMKKMRSKDRHNDKSLVPMNMLLYGPPGTGKSSMCFNDPKLSFRKILKIPDDKNGYILEAPCSREGMIDADNMASTIKKTDKLAHVKIILNEFRDDSIIRIIQLPKIK